jgi:hypothetical protein
VVSGEVEAWGRFRIVGEAVPGAAQLAPGGGLLNVPAGYGPGDDQPLDLRRSFEDRVVPFMTFVTCRNRPLSKTSAGVSVGLYRPLSPVCRTGSTTGSSNSNSEISCGGADDATSDGAGARHPRAGVPRAHRCGDPASDAVPTRPARGQDVSDLDFFVTVACWKPACVLEGPTRARRRGLAVGQSA